MSKGGPVGDRSVSEHGQWPEGLSVARTRVARPTGTLNQMRRFYGELLGLPELGSFEGHAGYSGVFFGLPGLDHHLEFTQQENGSPCPPPTRDSLLVLYFNDGVADRPDRGTADSRRSSTGRTREPVLDDDRRQRDRGRSGRLARGVGEAASLKRSSRAAFTMTA